MFGKKSRKHKLASIQRGMRQSFIDSNPISEGAIEDIIPKKCSLYQVKVKSCVNTKLITLDNKVILFENDKELVPTLRTLHKYPCLLPKMQIDQGGIKFILNGAHVMAPGLTSPGGKMDDVKANTVVGIYGEGKEHAMAIGITKMSTEDMQFFQISRTINENIAIEVWHHLNDGLWNLTEIKK